MVLLGLTLQTTPEGHTHDPFTQTELVGQTWPQAPQLLTSILVFVQIPLHIVVPSEHSHFPFTQAASGGQWLPQLPQLLGSLLVFVQVPPHSVKPVGQAH
jgi:hypothetical protein